MKASVIIPTMNPNLDKLKGCLNCLKSSDVEIIVVENPKTELVSSFLSLYDKKIVHLESDIGANKARNVGAKAATTNVFIFIDDDVLPSVGFVDAHVASHSLYRPGVVGGPVELLYEDGRPSWITGDMEGYFARVDSDSDRGMAYEVVRHWELHVPIVSANMSFTKDMFNRFGGFDESQGYVGRNLLAANDELTIVTKAEKCNPGILMINAPVTHVISRDRTTPDYLIRRAYGQGVADFRSIRILHPHMTTLQAFEYMLLNCSDLFRTDTHEKYVDYSKLDRLARIFATLVYTRIRLSYVQGLMSQTHD